MPHCSQVAVKTGDTVKQGDKIGEAGDTGHTEDGIRVGVYRFPTGGCGAGDRRRWDGERIYRER